MITNHTAHRFESLILTIRRLRGEPGCPWDRKQTTRTLTRYLQEEFQEIMTAIGNDDRENLCEELGDFLYLIIMLAEINAEERFFVLDDVLTTINDKLIRRHPHVFADARVLDEQALKKQWQEIKDQEKSQKR